MGILSKIFNLKDTPSPVGKQLEWIQLVENQQLETIELQSDQKPIVIFKHSTRCGISSFVLKKFENTTNLDPDLINFYFLDILKYRDLSNELAAKHKILHQSPQLIIIRKKNAIAHASHHDILKLDLHKFAYH